MAGSAFNAFKACVPIQWSPRLYITLVRGLPGTRKLHRRTLYAMRLRRCHRTVVHRTTPSLVGMLNQVKRLVVVETEAMFNARKQKEEEHRALRLPIVVSHAPPPAPAQQPAQ
ncbi:putative ribosomal protein L30, bacterial-type [Dioscorea sansibarensis]